MTTNDKFTSGNKSRSRISDSESTTTLTGGMETHQREQKRPSAPKVIIDSKPTYSAVDSAELGSSTAASHQSTRSAKHHHPIHHQQNSYNKFVS